jgi:Lrp/AsnC family transcriptional regulator for asnA, asnC and gidA
VKIDEVDEAIMAAFRADGRQSNREVARRLDISEGTVRQRLKRLQEAGAIRFDVISDAARMGITFLAYVRASVEPRHLEAFLESTAALPDLWYLAAVVGRYNAIALIASSSASVAMQRINTHIVPLPGVNEIDVRPVVGQIKYDHYEIVIPRERGG